MSFLAVLARDLAFTAFAQLKQRRFSAKILFLSLGAVTLLHEIALCSVFSQ